MRTGGTLETAAQPQPHTQTQHSPWHSPVPYLFGGIAAMLGLIAFSLLVLACSYWKLSGFLGSTAADRDAEPTAAEGKADDNIKPLPAAFESNVLVIMAGEEKPTFLATPASVRVSSFGDKSSSGSTCNGERGDKTVEWPEKPRCEIGRSGDDRVGDGQGESHEPSDQIV
ncbi:hypothetical protein Nepgr_018468 [Nepenthes gracilis]|uniref:Uncharacterized protein n=1 Tax=Nepenthes gracilis TaxID=150966 RepID=A0AAD3ST55_NEPGR|nr:hypothetical protein Nepgr_018468 [Nepenthes gracilis]